MKQTTWFKGDECEYTGREFDLYGGHFYEVKMLEGHTKGELRLISRAPGE